MKRMMGRKGKRRRRKRSRGRLRRKRRQTYEEEEVDDEDEEDEDEKEEVEEEDERWEECGRGRDGDERRCYQSATARRHRVTINQAVAVTAATAGGQGGDWAFEMQMSL